MSEWLLKSLGSAAASAALELRKTRFSEGHDFQTLRKNYQGVIHRAGLVLFSALVKRVQQRPFQGLPVCRKDSLLGDAVPSALRKTFFSSRASGPRDLDLRSGLQKTRRRHAGSSSREAGQECRPRREAWVQKPRNQPAPKGRKIKAPGHAASAPTKSGLPRLDRGRKQHLAQLHLRKPA